MKTGRILMGVVALVCLAACSNSQRWQSEAYQPYYGDPMGPRADWSHGEVVAEEDWKRALDDQNVPTKADGVTYDRGADDGRSHLWFDGEMPWR